MIEMFIPGDAMVPTQKLAQLTRRKSPLAQTFSGDQSNYEAAGKVFFIVFSIL